jgi:MFS family permease
MPVSDSVRSVTATAPDPVHRRRWIVLVVVAVARLMVVLDSAIVNIALPSAQRDIGFSADGRQRVVTAYSLAFGGLLLVGGRVADLIGRRRAGDRPAAQTQAAIHGYATAYRWAAGVLRCRDGRLPVALPEQAALRGSVTAAPAGAHATSMTKEP